MSKPGSGPGGAGEAGCAALLSAMQETAETKSNLIGYVQSMIDAGTPPDADSLNQIYLLLNDLSKTLKDYSVVYINHCPIPPQPVPA